MRIGLVCPYSFDVPGGVQQHVRDLADKLISDGHEVSVLAPADEETEVPDYLTSSGSAIPVPYNGSVARLSFGPATAARTARWLSAGRFDLLHIHEPFAPSVGLIALRHTEAPVVATFHSAQVRSRALQAAYPLVRPGLERIRARIAVSEDARRTVVDHLGGDAVIIPNGVDTGRYAAAEPNPAWQGTPERPTIAFLGRLDEPRKGLQVLTEAIGQVLAEAPGARFLIAGRGEGSTAHRAARQFGTSVEVLGPIDDEQKAALFSSVDLYVAPQVGGESFGMVLTEASSAGACVIASDLPPFRRVLAGGEAGYLFRTGSPGDLARVIGTALTDPAEREAKRQRAMANAAQYDWDVVAARIVDVYAMVSEAAQVHTTSRLPSLRRLLRGRR